MGTAIHPSEYALQKGEPDVKVHVQACRHCQARVQAMLDAAQRFERDVFPSTLPLVRQRLSVRPSAGRWRPLFWLPIGACAAIVLLLATQSIRHTKTGSGTPAHFGVKGQGDTYPGGLELVVKRAEKVAPLPPGHALRAGDAVRFVYQGEQAQYLELSVLDGEGHMQRFYPLQGPAPLTSPGFAFPGAVVVDDRPGAEQLLLRASNEPFTEHSNAASVQVYQIRIKKE